MSSKKKYRMIFYIAICIVFILIIVKIFNPTYPKITGFENKDNNTTISWKNFHGATKYTLLEKAGEDWQEIAQTEENKYTIENVEKNVLHTYAVKAYKNDKQVGAVYEPGFENAYYDALEFDTAEITKDQVFLSWEKKDGIKKYEIYLKTDSDFKKIATTKEGEYTYNKAKKGKTYTFSLRGINDKGQAQSDFDNTGTTLTFLDTPVITEVTDDAQDVLISWDKVDGAQKYRVLYDEGNGYQTAGDTEETSYRFTQGVKDTTYNFAVRCVSSDSKALMSDYDKKGYEFEYTFEEKTEYHIKGAPVINQDELKAGCETYACTMLLQYLGFDITEFQFADNYLITAPVTGVEGDRYGPDPNSAFSGDVYSGWGWCIYNPAMAKSMNNFFKDQKSDLKAVPIDGKSLDYLCNKYIVNDQPVMVWATTQMNEPIDSTSWTIDYVDENAKYKMGDTFTWQQNEHCLLLVGFDEDNYYFNDSCAGDVSVFPKELSQKRYEQLGTQAIVVQ